MEWLIILVLLAGMGVWWLLGLITAGWQPAVAAAAERHRGLRVLPRGARPDVLAGTVGGRAVSVRLDLRDVDRKGGGWFEISVGARLPAGIVLRREGLGSRLRAVVAGEDVQIGVPGFDESVYISAHGSPHDIVSRLDGAVRGPVLELLALGELRTSHGRVIARRVIGDLDGNTLGRHIALLAAVVAGLEDDLTTAERLACGVIEDQDPGYRLRCFALATSASDSEAARDLARRCLTHKDLLVRVHAARFLRDDAAERALNAVLQSPSTPAEPRAAALDALAELARPPGTTLLVEHLTVDSPAVRAAAARCLGQIGSDGAVEALVRLLDEPMVEVRIAAIDALGNCAPPSTIPRLSAHGQGVLRDAAEKRAARDAVARLQARHAGDAGRLSLVEPDSRGALTVVPEAEAAER